MPGVLGAMVREAGELLVAGERVAVVLPRQLIFEIAPAALGHEVSGVTNAARAALELDARWETLLRTWAQAVDSPAGARLKRVALSDSAAGFLALDRAALLEHGLGPDVLAPAGAVASYARLLDGIGAVQAGHTVTTSALGGVDHAAWITLGPAVSADLRALVADAPLTGWDSGSAARLGVEEVRARAAVSAASVLAHEGWHARLSRVAEDLAGAPFPVTADEARTQLAAELSGNITQLTRAIAGADPSRAHLELVTGGLHAAPVAALDTHLAAHGVSTPADQLAWIERATIENLRAVPGLGVQPPGWL